MKTPRLLTSALLLTLVVSTASPALADERLWSGGLNTNFNAGSNYTPGTALNSASELVFNSTTSALLEMTAGLGITSVEVRAGADDFKLNGTSALTVNSGGITVRSGVDALFGVQINSNGAATGFNFNVETGARMVVTKAVVPFNRVFNKTGGGTLRLDVGMGSASENFLRNGTAININEGTLEIGDAAIFEPGSTLASLSVHVGTVSTQGTLMGGGTLVGGAGKSVRVYTHGVANSVIAPAGDGMLAIQHLDASAGGTFRMELGESLIFGGGTFTGSTAAGGLVLDIWGGEVGVEYTLFNYGTLSGVDVSDFLIQTSGYEVDFWNIENGAVKVQFAAVPEPSAAWALGGLLILGWRRARSRRG